MIVALNVGSKCAVMLPRKLVNSQLTPAKGLIINKLLDSRSLILVEEVWQFKGLETSPLSEMCTPSGKIRTSNWGWQEVPLLMEDYLVVPAGLENMMNISTLTLENMIKKSIGDFKRIRGLV